MGWYLESWYLELYFVTHVYMEALLGMTRGSIILDVVYFSKKGPFSDQIGVVWS